MLCPSKSKGEVPGLSASEQRTFLQSLWEHLRGNGMAQPTTQCEPTSLLSNYLPFCHQVPHDTLLCRCSG